MGRLDGKTAIVTGASSGIGAATARMLADEGAQGRRRRAPRRAARDRGRARARRHRPRELRAVRRRRRPGGHPRERGRPRARARPVHRVDRGGRAHGLRDERQRPRAHDAARAPALAARAGPHRQHRLGRRPLGLPERRDLRHRRSSPCAASRARCARTCSAATSASRPSTPASSRPSSRSSASAATRRKAKSVYEGTRPLSADDVADAILFAVTRPPHVVVDELRADVDRPVERRPHPPQHLRRRC